MTAFHPGRDRARTGASSALPEDGPAPPYAAAPRDDPAVYPSSPQEPPPSVRPPGREAPQGHTRASGLWTAAVAAAALGILLVVFVLQNGQDVTVSFLWMDGQVPLAAALLLAAALGGLLVAVPGVARGRGFFSRNERCPLARSPDMLRGTRIFAPCTGRNRTRGSRAP
jgi:lipopolysaccharide assembly protein A